METKKKIGTCVWWNILRGIGFISDGIDIQVEDRRDYFVHYSGLAFGKAGTKHMVSGKVYEYEVGERNGKSLAINVRPVEGIVGQIYSVNGEKV